MQNAPSTLPNVHKNVVFAPLNVHKNVVFAPLNVHKNVNYLRIQFIFNNLQKKSLFAPIYPYNFMQSAGCEKGSHRVVRCGPCSVCLGERVN